MVKVLSWQPATAASDGITVQSIATSDRNQPEQFWGAGVHLNVTLGTASALVAPGHPIFPVLGYFSFITLTTVGYGDRFPVTTEGRAVAVMLMTAGVGLFGTLSGVVATWFLAPSATESNKEVQELTAVVNDLKIAGYWPTGAATRYIRRRHFGHLSALGEKVMATNSKIEWTEATWNPVAGL